MASNGVVHDATQVVTTVATRLSPELLGLIALNVVLLGGIFWHDARIQDIAAQQQAVRARIGEQILVACFEHQFPGTPLPPLRKD